HERMFVVYNPTDSVPRGWYRVSSIDNAASLHVGSIVLARLPVDVQRGGVVDTADPVPAARHAVRRVVDHEHAFMRRHRHDVRRAQRSQADAHAGEEHAPPHLNAPRARCAACRSVV
ncbi:MAG: hypothetical protein EOO54_26470, partial [Haliea sp.]